MTIQYDRRVEVKVDTLDIKGLHASFRVVKTLKKEPNTCELTIYNLTQDHRDQIAQADKPIVEIKAGYNGRETAGGALAAAAAVTSAFGASEESDDAGFGTIFLGNVRDADSGYEPPTWTTSLESGDGERATRFSRINRSFAAGTSLATVMNEVAKSMQVGIGNAAKKAAEGNLLDAGTEFLNSVTMSGQASKEMDRITKSAGLEWSIQDGVFQLLDPGKPLEDTSIVIKDKTGLIGSPTIGNDGIIRFRTLLNADIVPGRQIELSSKVLGGGADIGVIADLDFGLGLGAEPPVSRFRCERVEYIGSNFDHDFYCDIEATEL